MIPQPEPEIVEELKAASVEDIASVGGFTNLSASKVVNGAKEL